MSKSNKTKNKKLSQKIVQKTAMRRVVIASSALAIVVCTFIYVNFSQTSDSRAASKENNYRITYRTTDMVVPVRLLKAPAATERTLQSNYKNTVTANRTYTTRTQEVTNINAE